MYVEKFSSKIRIWVQTFLKSMHMRGLHKVRGNVYYVKIMYMFQKRLQRLA